MDEEAIAIASDTRLKDFIPAYGDRLAVKEFCLKAKTPRGGTKRCLKDLIKDMAEEKKKKKTEDKEENIEKQDKKEKVAKVKSRNVYFGWIHVDLDISTHMPKQKGGGSIPAKMPITATKEDLLEKAKEIFFISKKNPKGTVTDFVFDLVDYKENSLDCSLTVEDFYEAMGSKNTRLKVYLQSKYKFYENA